MISVVSHSEVGRSLQREVSGGAVGVKAPGPGRRAQPHCSVSSAGLSRCPDLKAAPRDRKLYLVLRFTVIKYIVLGECAAGPMNHFLGWLL